MRCPPNKCMCFNIYWICHIFENLYPGSRIDELTRRAGASKLCTAVAGSTEPLGWSGVLAYHRLHTLLAHRSKIRARKISNHAMSDSDRTTLARRMMYSTYIESLYIDWCGLWQFQRKCKALFCEFMYMFAFNGNDMNQMDFCIHSITIENEMDFAFVNCLINIKKEFVYVIVRVSFYVDQK